MARITDKERVSADLRRVAQSTKNVYEPWEKEYSCDLLEDYYYGKQWQGEDEEWLRRKYVINLFFPSVNISEPSILFQPPVFKVTARPSRIDDPSSDAEARAKLQEHTLNTLVQDPDLGFMLETGLARFDAEFRFGMVQVGYTADFIDNPLAGRPMLSDKVDEQTGQGVPMSDGAGNPVLEANVTLRSEELFLKWIPAKTIRVSEKNHNRLEKCDWAAYYEWHYIDDLKNNKRYKNTSSLNATARMKGDKEPAAPDGTSHINMVKVWFLWDLRKKERRIFPEGGEKYFLEEPFRFLPFATLKHHEILGQFFPLPPTFNWVHPQNQLNDGREMRRVHRKRAIRRYLYRESAFVNPQEALAKLSEDEDMTAVDVTGDPTTVMVPVPDAPLDPAIFRDMADHIEDFTRTSGVSGEAQQVAQSETATQANLIALMGRVRENAKRQQVGQWLSAIGRLILLTIRDNMALPIWIKKSVDPYSPLAGMEAQEVQYLWQQNIAEDLGDIDNDITVDHASMSPVAQAEERTDWLTFLQIMTNPQIGMILGQSPGLMRKTAALFNIRSERDLQEVSQALQMTALMMAGAGAAGGMGVGPKPGPGPVPSNSETGNQLAKQLPVEINQ